MTGNSYIGRAQARSELYDLQNDPSETTNLFSDKPEQAAHLQELLKNHFTAGASRPGARAAGRPLTAILAEKEARNERVAAIAEQADLK
jgi:hypothetical protein